MTDATLIAISGDLTMGHVADAMKRIVNMPKKSEVIIDLGQAKDADSSAVAFLLNCLRVARQRGTSLRFMSVPQSILTLADIYGLQSVISDAMLRS